MKRIIFLSLTIFLANSTFSQQKDFEGIVVRKVDVISKVEGVSNRVYQHSLLLGDSDTSYIKQGNYRKSFPLGDYYYISKKEKLYIKFKGIDTLFYVDYGSDSSIVKNIFKTKEQKKIAGYDCKAITMETNVFSKKYFYAPVLYMNPEYDRNNKISRYDVYTKEAAAIYLSCITEYEYFTILEDCKSLQSKPLQDSIFDLPNLPESAFNLESITRPPQFSGHGGWGNYLQKNLNVELGNKYIKIPRGEQTALQTVIVSFFISDKGRVLAPQVINKKEVHPKLAEEAIRVISASPLWKPATAFGEKIVYRYNQPITFQTSKG